MINDIKKLLKPYRCDDLRRYGGFIDGGYIYEKNLLEKTPVVYSYGIGTPTWISFDVEMAQMGKHVYMYDGSVSHVANPNPNLHFFKVFVNSSNIEYHIKSNGHENLSDMILKMDIEGNEYETLLNCNNAIFNCFNQISIEIHNVITSGPDDKIKLLSLLNTNYKLVHIHGNNSLRDLCEGVCDVLELTYIRKDCAEHLNEFSNKPCPNTELDARNEINQPELVLDWWLEND
jgi:hypothetical protein